MVEVLPGWLGVLGVLGVLEAWLASALSWDVSSWRVGVVVPLSSLTRWMLYRVATLPGEHPAPRGYSEGAVSARRESKGQRWKGREMKGT